MHICDEDVWLTLGFPKGEVEITRNPSFARNKLIDQWAIEIGKPKGEILPIDVVNAMLSDHDGGKKFKMNFLILLEFCLIECPA